MKTFSPRQATHRFLDWFAASDKARAAIVYALLIILMYAPVVLFGRSLQAPLYTSHGVMDSGAYQYDGHKPVNTFNIDLATPAYYEWPINVLVGDMYREGTLPLWNAYQGGGSPLAAQFSSRAFFPYQVLEDILPDNLWDFFLLGRLWIAGFFTFLFLRRLGLRWVCALVGGIFYMFSGTFTWFVNLEQLANVAMVAPVLLWAIEGLWHSAWPRGLTGVAIAVALVILGGQPETALFVLLLGTAYAIYRAVAERHAAPWRKLITAAAGLLTGLMLAAPLIVPFLELVLNSHNIHPLGGTMGIQGITRADFAPLLFQPAFSYYPTWIRDLPDNGVWDFLGGYIGVLPVVLLLFGLVAVCLKIKQPKTGVFLFFFVFGLSIILKNFGVPPFQWLGLVPLFDMAWSQRWAGPAWTLSFAISAAIALQMVIDQSEKGDVKQRVVNWLSVSSRPAAIFFGLALGLFFSWLYAGSNSYLGGLGLEPKQFVTSFAWGALGLGSLVALTGLALLSMQFRAKMGVAGLVVLALIELWFAIPRGLLSSDQTLLLIPSAIGLVAVGASILRLRRWFAALLAVAVVFSVVMVVLPERGLPDRYDPASESPYLAYLHEHLGQSRVVGVNGVLFPNYASALGVNDIRYILALAPENLHAYRSTLLHQEPLYGESSTSLWFTGNPQMDVRISDNSVRTQRDIGTDIISNLRYFSAMGVQYVLGPSGYDLDVDQSDGRMTDTKALKLVYDKEIRIWENLDVFPRIWVTSNLQKADTLGQALDTIKAKDFDLLSQAVIEGGPEIPGGPSAPVKWSAKITGYGHNTVLIEAELDKPGLLILSDTYYPGWEATVDGVQTTVFRVDGLFRGLYLNAGRHQIVFNYRPVSFLAGLGIAGLALMLLFALTGNRFRAGRKPRH